VTPASVTRIGESGLTLPILAFALLVSLGAGILFGLAPALHISSQATVGALKESARGATASRSANRLRNVFVIAEVALSAGQRQMGHTARCQNGGVRSNLIQDPSQECLSLGRPIVGILHINPGFNVSNVLTANVTLCSTRRKLFTSRPAPVNKTGNGPSCEFQVASRPPAAPGEESKAQIRCTTPDYFRALSISLLAGRAITESDSAAAANVIVINDVMAGRYWPDESPIGKRISFDETHDDMPIWREIVGVVQGVRHSGLEYEPEPQMYAPFSQFSMPFATLVVHTRGEPLSFSKTLRRAVEAADANEPVSAIRSMEQVLEQSIASRRFSVLMLGFFAALALLVASIGVYGVLSYAVSQRRPELGIRLALGSGVRAVMWLVMKQGMSLAVCGVCLGAGGSWLATRLLSTLLYKVSVTDPIVFGSIAVSLLAVAMLASYLPARRAAEVDPVVALRSD
jgi:hypothetical protein